jgi:hypothetical protein
VTRESSRESRLVREALQDPDGFARCRGRLDAAIAGSCESGAPWPVRVVVAIRAALEFAESERFAALVITAHAAHRRSTSTPDFAAMVEQWAARLRDGAPATRHPQRTAIAVVQRIARQILLQLELRPGVPPPRIAGDLIVFALTPYLGFVEALRWAEEEAPDR